MDGPFYLDTRPPFMGADLSTVTLSTTDKALYPKDNFPVLGGQYWAFIGKKMNLRAFGKITTAATPGNLTFDVYYGTGADANGTILASSAALTLVASQTNISWEVDLKIRCVTIGSAGALYVTGKFLIGSAVVAAANGLIPASAAASVGSLDLTAANIISLQAKRSGSTAETMTVQDLDIIAMN
jgi:hypothetical protein